AARHFFWMKRAAEAGYVDAMFLTALAYQNARGTQRDDEESATWIARAADAGHREALIARTLRRMESRAELAAGRRDALFRALRELNLAARALRNAHVVESADGGIAHFVTWRELERMLPSATPDADGVHGEIRLYNAAYSDDPWEGRRLLELDDSGARLLASFLDEPRDFDVDPSAYPELDHTVYLARLGLDPDSPLPLHAYAGDEPVFRLVTPLAAFDQQREGRKPYARIRRPLLPGQEPPSQSGVVTATLYQVKYEDDEVVDALAALAKPLGAVRSAADDLGAEMHALRALVRVILGEVLYLFQHPQRSRDREARLLASLPISSSLLGVDDRSPGRLYVDSPPLLFTTGGSRLVVPHDARDAAPAALNLKHRLARRGLLANTSVVIGG
ncbi:MAG: hypothetical protein R3286_11170, partial [Gammaproteobacteria bacterium]|nr:hypothetical protein [Gammaproteobacteria bacterium]